jgi:carbon-monoxide dehydrogenase medium subunit
MIPQTFEYTAPKTLDEAVKLAGDGAKLLAGGMSLIPMMKLRLAAPEHLVDLGRIKDLNYIREEGGALHIGATATHYSVESSALVRAKCPLLADTASAIGDVQVRNMGTMGGSVAHADPSADYPAALQALEAKVVIRGAKGERTVSSADFFVDSFTTTLEPGEIIREIVVPVEEAGTGTSYQKNVQPASGFAIVGIAARVRRSGGKITLARIGVTGLSNIGYRATAAEKALEGTAGSPEDVAKAAGLVSQGADANSDLHASSDYRKHLATVYAARAINAALAEAKA